MWNFHRVSAIVIIVDIFIPQRLLGEGSGVVVLFDKAASLTKEILDSTHLNFSVYDERCKCLNAVLTDLHATYSTKRQKGVEEIIASNPYFAVIIKFMIGLSECK